MTITHFSKLVQTRAEQLKDKVAFRHRDDANGSWIPTTWNQFSAKVKSAAKAIAALGIKEHDCISTFTQNKPEGLITDFGAYCNRAVVVPLYATSSVQQVEYIVNDSAARLLFVGEQYQYDIAMKALANMPTVEKVIIFDPAVKRVENDNISISFDEFLKLGEDNAMQALVDERINAASNDDLCTLIYTSGTTGEPKGVMLNHSNYLATMEIHKERLEILDDSSSMCFLPMAHIFERAWTYFCLEMSVRVEINLRPIDVQQSLRETLPNYMCAVPRFWEKVHAAVLDKKAKSKGVVLKLMEAALEVGREYNIEYRIKGKKAPMALSIRYKLFDKLVLSKIRMVAGLTNGHFFPCAGAALSPEVCEYLHSIGINIIIGYGLTETTATVTCYPSENFEFPTIGTTMPTLEVKIGENNEILVKGDTVMKGYYKKPEETAKVFTEDGFFRTGDAGGVTKDGNIFMTERIKDLFKTANGKYIAPQALETKIGADRFIEQIAVIGDQRKYVTALIIPAYEALKDYAAQKCISYKNLEDLLRNQNVQEMFNDRIQKLQDNFASFEQVKKFTLLPSPFTMETGELTNTLKLRRLIINQRYKEVIEAMYI